MIVALAAGGWLVAALLLAALLGTAMKQADRAEPAPPPRSGR